MKPYIPTLNVNLLLKVADTIAKHPQAFDMGDWDCGTTACIAGWALRLSGKRYGLSKDGMFSSADAASALGLKQGDALKLFFRINWPATFCNERYLADKISVTIARIHHFIRTGL